MVTIIIFKLSCTLVLGNTIIDAIHFSRWGLGVLSYHWLRLRDSKIYHEVDYRFNKFCGIMVASLIFIPMFRV